MNLGGRVNNGLFTFKFEILEIIYNLKLLFGG